jgi:hypothetical protein
MKCRGKYKYGNKVYECGRGFGSTPDELCKHWTFRPKDEKVPVSVTRECEHFERLYSDEFIETFLRHK